MADAAAARRGGRPLTASDDSLEYAEHPFTIRRQRPFRSRRQIGNAWIFAFCRLVLRRRRFRTRHPHAQRSNLYPANAFDRHFRLHAAEETPVRMQDRAVCDVAGLINRYPTGLRASRVGKGLDIISRGIGGVVTDGGTIKRRATYDERRARLPRMSRKGSGKGVQAASKMPAAISGSKARARRTWRHEAGIGDRTPSENGPVVGYRAAMG